MQIFPHFYGVDCVFCCRAFIRFDICNVFILALELFKLYANGGTQNVFSPKGDSVVTSCFLFSVPLSGIINHSSS